MAHQLMGHAAVNDKPAGNRAMFQHTLVAALDDASDELMGRSVANLAL